MTSRGLEIQAQPERALGDAIAVGTGEDTVQQRVVAAQLSAVHPALYAEASRRAPPATAIPPVLNSLFHDRGGSGSPVALIPHDHEIAGWVGGAAGGQTS